MVFLLDINFQGNVEYFRLLLSDNLTTTWKGLCPHLLQLFQQFPPCLCQKLLKDKTPIKKVNLIFVDKIKFKNLVVKQFCRRYICGYIHTCT